MNASGVGPVHKAVYSRLNGTVFTDTPEIHGGKAPETAAAPYMWIVPPDGLPLPKTSTSRAQIVAVEIRVVSDEIDPVELYRILSEIREAMTADLDLSADSFKHYGSSEPQEEPDMEPGPQGGVRHKGTFTQDIWVIPTA